MQGKAGQAVRRMHLGSGGYGTHAHLLLTYICTARLIGILSPLLRTYLLHTCNIGRCEYLRLNLLTEKDVIPMHTGPGAEMSLTNAHFRVDWESGTDIYPDIAPMLTLVTTHIAVISHSPG